MSKTYAKIPIFLFVISCFCLHTMSAQDAIQVAPKYYKLKLENDRVRVLETYANAGDTIPMHSHPAGFAYAVTPCKITFIFPDGKTKLMNLPAGEVLWHEPMKHAMIIHDHPVRIIHTELKENVKTDQQQNTK